MKKAKDSQNKTLPEDDQLEIIKIALKETMAILQPLTDFHKALASANEDDLRMYWDIRVVGGESTPIVSIQGTEIMPNMLAPRMVALAPTNIQNEITQMIPLSNAFMEKFNLNVPDAESPSPQ